MRPVCPAVDGLPSFLGPISFSEMSMLQPLEPVQTWLGQELEKCGIDAMIYSRYVLSLLLHDSCDYDLQEQGNYFFTGSKKLKDEKKSSDLTEEEKKKQAAVECLLSASDEESSDIVQLVDDLCTKLKDLKNGESNQLAENGGDVSKKNDASPTRKDQAEMYYEAFPPLSEKPIYLQEIMTVWNKSKISSHSSSSSTTPHTSMETSPQKNSYSECEDMTSIKNGATVNGNSQEMKCESEKENEFSNGAVDDKTNQLKSVRHKSFACNRVRTWSTGSSEAGSSECSNHSKPKTLKLRHKSKPYLNKEENDPKVPSKNYKEKNVAATGAAGSVKPTFKRAKHNKRECAYKGIDNEGDVLKEKNENEVGVLPSWYTEPIDPLNNKSKLKSYKRNGHKSNTDELEDMSESENHVHQNKNAQRYFSMGRFVNGQFVEVETLLPAALAEIPNDTGTSKPSLQEDSYLDDVHPIEPTRFYEVEIDQSMLDLGASAKPEGGSRILNMIRQKSNQTNEMEFDSSNMLKFVAERDIWPDNFIWTNKTYGLQWPPWSPLSSVDADRESLGGGSLHPFSSYSNSTILNAFFNTVKQDFDSKHKYSSIDQQICNSVHFLPKEEGKAESTFKKPLRLGQSLLRSWTRNSAFENEQCSNNSRACSPWSNSEGTRSDSEALNSYSEDFYIPSFTVTDEDEIPGLTSQNSFVSRVPAEDPELVRVRSSRLERDYGRSLEPKNELPEIEEDPLHRIALWVFEVCPHILETGEDDEPFDLNVLSCGLANDIKPNEAVTIPEYHLWDTQENPIEKAFFSCKSSIAFEKDYMTRSKSWDQFEKRPNSFIAGGTYGGFGDDFWAVEPNNSVKSVPGSDVLTPEDKIAPGHHLLWRPIASSEENEHYGEKSSNKGFLPLHENMHGTNEKLSVGKSDKGNSISAVELNKRFSQALHVECSFDSGNIVSSPSCKPKALCSDLEGDICYPRICDVDNTDYRSIRISPRTHFRPITPVIGNESDLESEKEEVVPTETDVADDPQDHLGPLEEDAEKETPCYGMFELKCGMLRPCMPVGMEKSAQTSLDGQEEAVLLQESKDNSNLKDNSESDVMEKSEYSCEISVNDIVEETPNTECKPSSGELEKGPFLNIPSLSDMEGLMCQNLMSEYRCDRLPADAKEENCVALTVGNCAPCADSPPLEKEEVDLSVVEQEMTVDGIISS